MTRRLAALSLPLVAAALIAGCGSGSDASTKPTASGAQTAARAPARSDNSITAESGTATVTTTEFAFAPMVITAPAGPLKLTLDNQGKIPHEIVVLKTNQAADSLKVRAGRVGESSSVGEVSETAAGASKSSTLKLKPGRYVFVCNIPGHSRMECAEPSRSDDPRGPRPPDARQMRVSCSTHRGCVPSASPGCRPKGDTT